MFAGWHDAWPVIIIIITRSAGIIVPGFHHHAKVADHFLILSCTHGIAKILLESKLWASYAQVAIHAYVSTIGKTISVRCLGAVVIPEASTIIGKTIYLEWYVDLTTKFYQD